MTLFRSHYTSEQCGRPPRESGIRVNEVKPGCKMSYGAFRNLCISCVEEESATYEKLSYIFKVCSTLHAW